MNQQDTFFDILDRNYKNLSKKQVRLADYIRRNYKTAVFLSCVPMAKEVGISEATVVRFANALGYEGFTEMIGHIQDYIKNEMTTVEKLEGYEALNRHSDIFKEVIDESVKVIKSLPKLVTQEKIDQVVKDMRESKKIFLVGFESAGGLVEYVGYHLNRVGFYVEILNEKSGDLLSAVNSADSGCYVMSICFPRYAKSQIRLTDMLSQKGTKVFVVTDGPKSPLLQYSSYSLFFPLQSSFTIYTEIYAAILTFFQILLYEVGLKDYDKTKQSLLNLEEYNKFFEIF